MISYPNESEEYRKSRDALLQSEISWREHIERTAELRRKLPPEEKVKKDYDFETTDGYRGLIRAVFGQ